MSKINNFIGYGSTGAGLFLDLFPSEYYYSLNRGGEMTGNVIEIAGSDYTPEDLLNITATNQRITTLYNQGSVNRQVSQGNNNLRPYLTDNNGDIEIINSKAFINFSIVNSFLQSVSSASILDEDSTLYMVYFSQDTQSLSGVLQEGFGNFQRITIFSDTRNTIFRHTFYSPTAPNTFLNYSQQQPTQELRVVAYRKTGTLIEAFDENGLVDSATSSEVFPGQASIRIGQQFIGSLFFRGLFGMVAIREQADSNSEMTNIINFLKNEYGI